MLHIALLGRYDVRLNDEPLKLTSRPVQNLLAYLLLNRDKRHRREQLAGILWPDYTEASARKNLRNTLYRLRQVIGEGYLAADRSNVSFNTDAAFWLDVAQLEDTTAAGEIEEGIQAVSLYRGELLPGYYEDWVLWERERLQALFERQIRGLLERLNAAGRWSESQTWAEHWIAQGQAPEPAYRTLMAAHAAQGDQASMVQAYRRGRRALEEALGIPLSPVTERLYLDLLDGGGEVIATPAAADVQISTASGPAPRGVFLRPVTPIIGRQKEIAELQRLLEDEARGRLVTIIGPGGIGKTRLSLETAAEVAEGFPDGVFFVPLAPLTDAQHIGATISETIGFQYLGTGDLRQGLLDYLRQKRLLLVMDNFEHLLAGADMVSDILQNASKVKVLSTSRERLNLSGEAVYTLSGLDYPADLGLPGEEVKQFGAIQLLLDRTRLIHLGLEVEGPALDHVARICRLVQGMPLALVLAAGWLELLTFEEVADEIAASLDILESHARDIPERQRSVRAAFDYSWQQLASDDRQAFSRLAVFRGGFSRQAAQQVAGVGLRTLRTLIEKSLITAGGPDRYSVHELLRQFAEEKLEEAGVAAPNRDAHSHYYLEAVAQLDVDLKGRRQLHSLEEIEADLDNLRAAWDWALERHDERSIDLALESLSLFFYMRSRYQEGCVLLQHALQRLVVVQPLIGDSLRLWGRLKARSGLLQSQFTQLAPEIEQTLKKSLAIAETNTELTEIAYSYLALGYYHTRVTGDQQQALNYFKQSLKRYQTLADLYYVAHSLHRVGYSTSLVTGTEEYMHYTRQSLELARQIGDLSDETYALGNMAAGSLWTGDYTGAELYLREALALSQQMGNRLILAHTLVQLGLCQLLEGRLEEVQETTTEGVRIANDIAFPLSQAYGLAVLSIWASLNIDYELGQRLAGESLDQFDNVLGDHLGHWAQATACAGLGQTEQGWEQAREALNIGYRWRGYGIMTWLLPVVAIILGQREQPERAAEILGLYFNHSASPIGWAEKWPLLSEWLVLLEENLGADGYREAWERGKSLDLATTVKELLEEG